MSVFYTSSSSEVMWFFVLYSDKTWIFDQSECVQSPIYIIIITGFNKYLLLTEFECCTVSYGPRFFLFNL